MRVLGAILHAFVGVGLVLAAAEAAAQATSEVRVRTLAAEGGHLDWLKAPGGRILFDRGGAHGYFDLWIMNADGTGPRNLTGGRPELPGLHTGQPAWHPSGRLIAFQAQKRGVPREYHRTSVPGAGVLNDLWLMTADDQRFWRLVDVKFELSKDSPGVLHPHFSTDGARLLWSERVGAGRSAFGAWAIKIADFAFDERSGPKLANVRTLTPGPAGGGGVFYETHGFSPDGRRILYSSDVDRGLEIYELELSTGRIVQLTDDPRTWDEHAQYSPDGRTIVWISSRGLDFHTRPFKLETEFWRMNADGSDKRRLTYFHQPGHPHYRGGGVTVAADSAWRADGRAFAGLVIRHLPDTDRRGQGEIVLVEWD